MKKRIFSFVLSLITVFALLPVNRASALDISAQAAVLMCVESGEVIFERNPHEKLSMASTTKIMTSLIALEAGMPEKEITVTKEMVAVEGTSMGLLEGDSVSLTELVYGMLLQSGNDAANTVATVLGGDAEGFAALMNERAEQIGMNNTNFVTASGLDDEEHYSTAYDMALLACECVGNPLFVSICSDKSETLTYGNPPYARTVTNHNKLLWSYPDCIGMKTGFTRKSGRCLVSAAKRNGVTLVAVTLNAPNDWSDHRQLLDYGFDKCKSGLLSCDVTDLQIRVFGSDVSSLPLELSGDTVGYLSDDTRCEVYIQPYVYAPTERGEIVGRAVFISDGKVTAETAIITSQSAEFYHVPKPKTEEKKENFLGKFIRKIKEYFVQR